MSNILVWINKAKPKKKTLMIAFNVSITFIVYTGEWICVFYIFTINCREFFAFILFLFCLTY